MSSASSGRYQSRLFKFAHQQSRRLTQQCDRAFRHFQVATSAVVPVLLYPIYLLFQSTRSAAKQLHQVQQSMDSQPQIPTIDTPIQKVLLAVNAWQLEQAVSTSSKGTLNFLALFKLRFRLSANSPKSTSNLTHPRVPTPQRPSIPFLDAPRPTIQGIATQFSSRILVLVTAENEILDILTVQQQQKLQERIIREVADYWRYQRLAHSGNQKLEHSLDSSSQALAFLDRTVAKLESKYLVLSEAAITASSFANTLCRRSWKTGQELSVFLSSKIQPAARKLSVTRLDKIISFDAKTDTKIQTLILAAINYFFGDRGRKSVQTKPSAKFLELPTNLKRRQSLSAHRAYKLPTAAQLHEDIDPWLTFNDLFGEESSTFSNSESSISQMTSQAGTNLSLPSKQTWYSLRNLLNRFQTFLPQSKQASEQVLQERTESLTRTTQSVLPATSLSLSQPQVSTSKSKQPHSQGTQLESQPDWIETNATAIGYVKHPLEQLLEWLDRVMLWLEKLLIRVLQRLQRLWLGK